MSRLRTLLGLPPFCLNTLAIGVTGWLVCVGINIIRAPHIALKVASTQVITSSSADKLENLAEQLKEQAKVIEQKDQAYQNLEQTYHDYLTNETGDIELGKAFDAMEELPEVGNIQEIQTEISETEEKLLDAVD